MYQSQTASLKESIIATNNFEACTVANQDYKGLKLLGSRRVPQSINSSNHHVYLDLANYRGKDIWLESDGIRYFFEKPSNENGINLPLWNSQTGFQLKSSDGRYSQVVSNVDLNHTLAGHSSTYFYADFVKDTQQPIPPIPDAPSEPSNPSNQSTLKEIINQLEQIIYRLDDLVDKL